MGVETLDDVDTDDDVETELEKGDFQKKIDITCWSILQLGKEIKTPK